MTERIYSLLSILITGLLIVRIWIYTTEKSLHRLAWLPIAFFAVTPLVMWTAANNMLENTLMIFTTLTVFFYIKSLDGKRYFYITWGSFSLLLAFLTKGPVALFPLSFFFLYWVVQKRYTWQRMLGDSVLMLSVFLLLFLLMCWIFPESSDMLMSYFQRQVVRSLESIQTVDTRFYIMGKWLMEFLPAILIVALVICLSRKRIVQHQLVLRWDWLLLFLMMGFSAVLPIMLSLKQSSFYLIPSIPWFSLAFAFSIRHPVSAWVQSIRLTARGWSLLRIVTLFFFLLSLSANLFFSATVGRNQQMISDVKSVLAQDPGHFITISKQIRSQWALHGYFARFGKVSLMKAGEDTAYPFALVKKGDEEEPWLKNYVRDSLRLHQFDLYRRDQE